MLTVEQFAKHFDLAYLAPDAQEADIIDACRTAAEYKVNSVNVNSTWIELVKKELAGSGVGPSAVIGFPYGACATKVKLFELEEMVKAGCTACDMVVNIGALKDKNYALVTDEIKNFVEICGKDCDTKLIFEVGFLSDEDIAALTKICCEQGVTYVKTATGSQAFPDIKHVKIMKENLSGDTKIKVSGVPRTFALPAAMYLFEHMGVSLVGTRSAGKLVQQYSEFLEECKK
ncbi:deoxyribose-phosphate aldolase [Eubacterium limosum]|uniref:deoxyribose-phosphate aldolase n=1 Tax=Eubacterium limosum TaxID=1736 RepID=UPI003711B01A